MATATAEWGEQGGWGGGATETADAAVLPDAISDTRMTLAKSSAVQQTIRIRIQNAYSADENSRK